jgi:hypothetical protein
VVGLFTTAGTKTTVTEPILHKLTVLVDSRNWTLLAGQSVPKTTPTRPCLS